MTLEQLKERIRENEEKREKLKTEISNLLKREAELNSAAIAAAESGSVEDYVAKMAEKKKVTDSIFVKRSCMDKITTSPDEADIESAWKSYTATYNKQLAKSQAAFNAEKEKLCKLYSDMVELQSEACAVREYLGDLLGLNNDHIQRRFEMDYIPARNGISEIGLLKLGGSFLVDPDANYFLANYSIKTGKNFLHDDLTTPTRIANIVGWHKSK